MPGLEESDVAALLQADTPQEALQATTKKPELLCLNVDLFLWDQQHTTQEYTAHSFFSGLREILAGARSVAPLRTLMLAESRWVELAGGLTAPPCLATDFTTVTRVQTRGTSAAPSDLSAAKRTLTELLEQLSSDTASTMRAVLLFTRADITRIGLSRTDSSAISQVSNDFLTAAKILSEQSFPLWRAHVLNKLGNHCQTFPLADPVTSLRSAIEYHTESLRLYTELGDAGDRGNVLHNLGNDYANLYRRTGEGRDAAIRNYNEALVIRTRTADPVSFVKTNHALGNLLANPGTETFRGSNARPMEDLDTAIRTLMTALDASGQNPTPLYGEIQHDLGTVYLERARVYGDKGNAGITKAIHSFEAARRVRSPALDASDYASTLNSLGVAYMLLESENALRQAERVFREALKYRSYDSEPDYFGDTQDNLGSVLLMLATDEQGVRTALASLEEALRARPLETRPYGYVQTMKNIGNAYEHLAKLGVDSAHVVAERYFSEAADALIQTGRGTDKESLMESLRSAKPAEYVW